VSVTHSVPHRIYPYRFPESKQVGNLNYREISVLRSHLVSLGNYHLHHQGS